MSELAKIFIVCGVLFLVVGVLILFVGKVPGIGKLPGDIMVKRENFTFYFPITTCIIISIILSIIIFLWKHK